MTSRVHSRHNGVPIAKLLAVEAQVGKLTSEMEKLILISTQHGSRIKELIVASTNSVSQVEMMSVVTTGRFQHINDLKALRSNLQMKYEQSQPGAVDSFLADEAENKEIKALSSRILDLQNEASNVNFKNGMEVNKLKVELKESKRDFDELKRFVTMLESKLGSFIQDAKDNGIKTSIGMEDMPEINVTRSAVSSPKASVLSSEGGQFSPHHGGVKSPFPIQEGQQHPQEYIPGQVPDLMQHNLHMQHMHTNTHSHSTIATDLSPLPDLHHQHAQQYQHYHQTMSAHSSYSQIYGVPISDSGLSSHTQSHANLIPSASQQSHLDGHGSLQHQYDQNSVPTLHTLGSAHRTLHPPHYSPYAQYAPYPMSTVHPNNTNTAYPTPYNAVHYTHPYYTQLLTLYPDIERSDLSQADKIEKYYKTQFVAMKDLIMASLQGGSIEHVQPLGSRSNDSAVNSVKSTTNPTTDQNTTTGNANTNTTTTINLRHRNRDLFHNLQRVKEVQNIALNYADFCVGNAVNVVDGAAYDKFQETLFESELERFHKKALSQGTVEVQTDAPYPNYTSNNTSNTNTAYSTANNSPDVNSRKSSVFGSAKVTTNRKRNSLLLRSQSERVRSPGTRNDAVNGNTEMDANDTADGVENDTFGDSAGIASNNHMRGGSNNNSSNNIRSVRTPPLLDGSRAMLQALQQLREEAAQDAEEHDEVSDLAELELPATAPLLDFGDTLLPTLYSSTGRRQSLSMTNPVKAASFRDPALDFLDIHDHTHSANTTNNISAKVNSNAIHFDDSSNTSTASVGNIHTTTSGDNTDYFGPGLLLASKTPSFRNSFLARKDSNNAIRPGSSGTNGVVGGTIGSANGSNRNLYASNTSNANNTNNTISATNTDVAQFREEMKTLMDKKLLSLYNALDARWQGLDSTNTSILAKLSRFQDVITDINEDNQRILSINQALSVRTVKLESRMFEALEPVYVALQHSRDSVQELEGLMIEVAKKIETVRSSGRDVPHNNASGVAYRGVLPMPQVPIEDIIKNGHNNPHCGGIGVAVISGTGGDVAGVTTGGGIASGGGYSSSSTDAGDYRIDSSLAPQPAHLMSEYELECVFRQLKEYSTLYKDMMHNYGALIKRLKEEDVRKSGNFALRKPHVTGTVELTDIVYEPVQHNEQHNAAHIHTTQASTLNTSLPHSENSLSYPLPHRVLVHKAPPLQKREVQSLLEHTDLSSHIEIIRIKNELARMRSALNMKDTSPSRQRGPIQMPATSFPSLFSHLGTVDFSLLHTQQQPGSPNNTAGASAGSPLRSRPPTGGGFNNTAGGGGNGSGRGGTGGDGGVQGVAVVPTRQRIPLEFSLNDELKSLSLSLGEASVYNTYNTPHTANTTHTNPSVYNSQAPNTAPNTHSNNLNTTSYTSSHNSIHSIPSIHSIQSMHSAHPTRAVTATSEGGYSIGGAEEDVGLDTESLSAYDFLLNPKQLEENTVVDANNNNSNGISTAGTTHTGTMLVPTLSTDKIIVPGSAVPRPAVHIVHAPAESSASTTTVRPKSRSVMWGSSTSINHNLPREGSFKGNKPTSASAKEAIKPTSAASTSRKGSLNTPLTTPTTKRKSSAVNKAVVYDEDSLRNVSVNMRADAIISGNTNHDVIGNHNQADTHSNTRGSVQTGMTAHPTPPTVSRALPSYTARKISSSGSGTSVGNNGTSGDEMYDARQVWQYSATVETSGNLGSEVAATPSVILQGGEYIPSEHYTDDTGVMNVHLPRSREQRSAGGARDGVNRSGNTATEHGYLNNADRSVDSVPTNTIGNLGENAFDE